MRDDALFMLKPKERDEVEGKNKPHTGFVQDFADWAARKTDAPPYTLRAAGLMALSLAAGDGVVVQSFFGGNLHLNLYMLVVGPSTIVRKTTVHNFIKDLMPILVDGTSLVTTLDDVSPHKSEMPKFNTERETSAKSSSNPSDTWELVFSNHAKSRNTPALYFRREITR